MRRETVTFAAVLLQILTTTSTVPLLHERVSSDIRASNTGYSLPTNVKPIHYKITLDPLIGEPIHVEEPGPIEEPVPSTFTGEVTIRVNVTEETGRITLHYNDLTIHDVSIKIAGTEIDLPVWHMYDPVTHFWIISHNTSAGDDAEETFKANEQYLITTTYTGLHQDDMYGFYRSSYKVTENKKVWLATTQFEPTHARRAFPCFDEPAFKATFEISIKKKRNLHAISNMPIKNDKDDEYFNFETTPIMSTYLIAFMVSDFKSEKAAANFHVWAREGAIEQVKYSVAVGPPLLIEMEKFLDLEYPMSKMDEVAVPDFSAGAMENWGLTTYRERLILYDEDHATASTKQQIATAAAHEFAHQWFGDLVSPEWWNFLWVNEGFATYFEFFATDMVEDEWRLKEQFVVRRLQNAFVSDALLTSHPMTQAVDSPNSVMSIFNTITYDKAGSVIRMMEHFLTTEVFKKGLKRYLESHKYSSANEDHLYDAINEAFQATKPELYTDVSPIMYTWTQQAGYPLLTVTSDRNQLTITQKRFLLSPTSAQEKDSSLWIIPLTYTTQDGDFQDTSTKEWMNSTSLKIVRPTGKNKWFIFNVQQTGYYRVNYDENNWALLISYLKSDNYKKIPPVNRAQLLDDSLNLARAGVLQYGTALELAEYLVKEVDYIPWYSALTAFTFLNLRLAGTDAYPLFKEYLRQLIQPMYEKLTFEESDSDSHVTKLHRSLILQWACDLGHEECIERAKSNFKTLQETGTRLSPNVHSVTYCVALRDGGEEEWNFLWEKYVVSNYATEQSIILTALGCTTKQSLIDGYLNKSIEDRENIRRQDAASVFFAVYSNPGGFQLAFNFLQKNYDSVALYYGTGVSNIITGIAGHITTQEQLDQFKKFVKGSELGAATEAARRAVESAKENLKWSEIRGSEIEAWLKGKWTTEPKPKLTPTNQGTSSLSLSPAVCMTLFLSCLYQLLTTFKVQ